MTDSKQIELKPCPFCGDVMEISGTIIRHREKTGCVINLQAWDSSAISAWNRRSALIDSAPDLLSVAKRWSALAGGSWNIDCHAREKQELLEATRAAIAKAGAN